MILLQIRWNASIEPSYICLNRTRGEGIQDKWDSWINASVFVFNTTVSSSIIVTPHMLEERQHAYKSMREVQGRRVERWMTTMM